MHPTNKKLLKAYRSPLILRQVIVGYLSYKQVYHLFKIFSHKHFKALPYFANKNSSVAFYGSPQVTELKDLYTQLQADLF